MMEQKKFSYQLNTSIYATILILKKSVPLQLQKIKGVMLCVWCG